MLRVRVSSSAPSLRSSTDRAAEAIPHLADLGAGLLNRLEEFDSPMGVYEIKKDQKFADIIRSTLVDTNRKMI